MKPFKKICIVSPLPPPFGGMAIQAVKLANLLEEEGFEITQVATNPELNPWLKFLGYIPFIRTIARQILFLLRLNNAVKDCHTVYFLTGFFNFFLWVTYPALLLLMAKKKRVILSARGGAARKYFKKHKYIIKPVLDRVDQITVPSGFLQSAFKDELGLDSVIVPNIADLKQFVFVKREHFAPKLIVTRSLEAIYDVGTVLKAFSIIHKKYPEAELGVVGDGSLKGNLINLVKELKLDGSVRFYGEVKHKEINMIYQNYDIFVNASKVDNLPGSILEAFATGLPIVSTNAGGIPFMVFDKENGLLSEIGDHKTLAENALRIIQNPDLGQALTMKGYVELNKYTWDYIKTVLTPLLSYES